MTSTTTSKPMSAASSPRLSGDAKLLNHCGMENDPVVRREWYPADVRKPQLPDMIPLGDPLTC